MKTSKIVLLIFSLIFLTACGKPDQNDHKNNSTMTYDEDKDGDLIPDYLDDQPEIANSPLEEVQFKLKLVDQSNDYESVFSFENFNKTKIYDFISLNYRKRNLNYKEEVVLSSKEFPKNYNHNSKFDFSYTSKTQLKNVQFQIKNAEASISSGVFIDYQSKDLFADLHNIQGQRFSLKIENFEFERNNQTYTFQEYLSSVKDKTYKLSLIGLKRTETYRISIGKSLEDALQEIGIDKNKANEMIFGSSPLFESHLSSVSDKISGWKLLNFNSESISRDDHIIFLEINKDIINKHQKIYREQNSNFYSPHFDIDISNIKSLELSVSGNIALYSQKNESKKAQYISGYGNNYVPKYEDCFYTYSEIIKNRYEISHFNLFSYYDIYIDNTKLHFNANQNFLLNNLKHQKLKFRLKAEYQTKVREGMSGLSDKILKGLLDDDYNKIPYFAKDYNKLINLELKIQMKQRLHAQ